MTKTLKEIAVAKCPFEDPENDQPFGPEVCPFHQVEHVQNPISSAEENANVRPKISFGRYKSDRHSEDILRSIGGGTVLRAMCTRFYAHAFRDRTLSAFMFESDGAAAHGQRLADWIVEKMGGEGRPWADSGREGMRQVSHARAWHSKRRPEAERGRRFKLTDCRAWMRLMFLSARQTGLHRHERFWLWYVAVISHFITIYEVTAGKYAEEDSRWSANEENVEEYVKNDFFMADL